MVMVIHKYLRQLISSQLTGSTMSLVTTFIDTSSPSSSAH